MFFSSPTSLWYRYQLCIPIPQSYLGIKYINKYLYHLILENSILNCFDYKLSIRVFEKYYQDYKGLLINLFEPVITNAIGLILIEKDPFPLQIINNDRAKIIKLFNSLSKSEINFTLLEAGKYFFKIAKITDKATKDYLFKVIDNLFLRLWIAYSNQNLENVFLSF